MTHILDDRVTSIIDQTMKIMHGVKGNTVVLLLTQDDFARFQAWLDSRGTPGVVIKGALAHIGQTQDNDSRVIWEGRVYPLVPA